MLEVFSVLLIKIIPLYAYILLGYVSTKFFKIERIAFAKLLLYVLSPAVIFFGTLSSKLNLEMIVLPTLVFTISCILATIYLIIGKYKYRESSNANLLAYGAGSANTGYFGLPVIAAVLGEKAFASAVLANFGMTIFEMSIGFCIAAKGRYSTKESIKKFLTLPHMYVLILALILNFLGLEMNPTLEACFTQVKSCFILLGMMIIGMAIANIRFNFKDTEYCLISMSSKFIAAPILAIILINIDQNYFNQLSTDGAAILLLLSCTPLAANAVVLATELELNSELAAISVIASTVVAFFFIPAMEILRLYNYLGF